MAARFRRLFAHILYAGCMLLGPCGASAWADGGRLVLIERQGNLRIFVFASPEPLRAGPIDISVLLQDAETGQPVDNAGVSVCLTPRRGGRVIRTVATKAAATNKLMYAAVMELPHSGLWDSEIAYVADRSLARRVRFTMEAGRPLPRWLTVWPWFGWPAGAVLLFAAHRWLVWRNQAKSVRKRNS
jgi:hypothetical protein